MFSCFFFFPHLTKILKNLCMETLKTSGHKIQVFLLAIKNTYHSNCAFHYKPDCCTPEANCGIIYLNVKIHRIYIYAYTPIKTSHKFYGILLLLPLINALPRYFVAFSKLSYNKTFKSYYFSLTI